MDNYLLRQISDAFGVPVSLLSDESVLAPKKVIYNGPATIVFWNDGTKTVVKCSECKEGCFASNMNCPYFDREKGLAMAFVKRTYDNHGRYYEMFKKNCKEEWEK